MTDFKNTSTIFDGFAWIQYKINCLSKRAKLTMILAYDVVHDVIIFARDAENVVAHCQIQDEWTIPSRSRDESRTRQARFDVARHHYNMIKLTNCPHGQKPVLQFKMSQNYHNFKWHCFSCNIYTDNLDNKILSR